MEGHLTGIKAISRFLWNRAHSPFRTALQLHVVRAVLLSLYNAEDLELPRAFHRRKSFAELRVDKGDVVACVKIDDCFAPVYPRSPIQNVPLGYRAGRSDRRLYSA